MEGIQKRLFFCQKCYIKGKGELLPQGGASEYNPLFSNIWVPLSLISPFTLTYFMIFVIPGLLFYGIMQLFGHLLLLTKETMKKVCVCLASTWYNHLVSNVTAYFVSIFPVIHSAHIAHEWLLLKHSAIILGWYIGFDRAIKTKLHMYFLGILLMNSTVTTDICRGSNSMSRFKHYVSKANSE